SPRAIITSVRCTVLGARRDGPGPTEAGGTGDAQAEAKRTAATTGTIMCVRRIGHSLPASSESNEGIAPCLGHPCDDESRDTKRLRQRHNRLRSTESPHDLQTPSTPSVVSCASPGPQRAR